MGNLPLSDRPGIRALVVLLGAVVVLHAAAFVLLTSFQRTQGDTVLTGVEVEGRDVGGLDRATLRATVDEVAATYLDGEVVVRAGDGEVSAPREVLGTEVATEDTVDRAWDRGRRGFYRPLWHHLRARQGSTVDLGVDVTLDAEVLDRWAATAADELSQPARDAALSFEVEDDAVTVDVTEPREGREVEAEAVVDAVEGAAVEPGDVTVEVDAEVRSPAITAADLDAVRVDAERAVSGPVVLTNPSAGDDLTLEPPAIAEVLRVEVDPDGDGGERLRLRGSVDGLREVLGEDGVGPLEAEPIDARFEVDGDAIDIVGGTPGLELDVETTADRVVEVATAEDGGPDDPREGELPGEITEPATTREELEDLGVQEEIGVFSTELTPGEPRNENLRLAAEHVDGTLVAPGEMFALNEAIGPRTRDRGFVENGFIDADGELTEVVGGGVSQLATTVFNAAWFAGVRVLDFQPHSLYFARYPMGREATISWGSVDLVFENDSPATIYLAATGTDTAVTVRFFGTDWAEVEAWTGEPYDEVEGETRDGFTVDFGRTVRPYDGEPRSEEHTHTYQPED